MTLRPFAVPLPAQVEEAHPGTRSRNGVAASSRTSSHSARDSIPGSSQIGDHDHDGDAHSRASDAAASHARPAPSVKSSASRKQAKGGAAGAGRNGKESFGRNSMMAQNTGAGHAAYSVHAGGSSQVTCSVASCSVRCQVL